MNEAIHELDIRETIRHIDQMDAEIRRTRDLTRWEPWKVAFAGMIAGAALLTAGAAIGGFIATAVLRGFHP